MRSIEFITEVKARYEMTDLDPWTFDQTPAGWRGLPSSARQADAIRQYIDRYVKNGRFVGAPEGAKTLRPHILYWHLGQVLTQMGRNGMAVGVMRQALDDSDPNWNAYVMATISFLRKDRRDFDHWAPLARGNEETIQRLTAGWGLPYKQAYAGQKAVTEDSFQGIDISMEREDDEIMVRASAGGKQLGSVLFVEYDGYLMPQDLEVDERFRGQGIARTMYDYVKSKGYRIRRSGQQTDAGQGFWAKHRPDDNVWEDREQYLYHATYRPLLKSIRDNGLGNTTQSQWTDSQSGVVYLARDAEVARSYAEAAESVPDDWLDQIVIFKIKSNKLDQSRLFVDKNVQDNQGDTLEYHGVIPVRDLKITENFADGKIRGKSRPGRVKRAGASCKGSVTDLRARAKKYGGERGKMYHWCANMKSGRKK